MFYFQHYFVVSPKDVVVGKPRDEDDHIDWLLEQGSFETSLDFAEDKARLLRRHNVLKVKAWANPLNTNQLNTVGAA